MIDYSRLTYRVEPMKPEDVNAIMEIENEAFSAPWSARAYDYELHYNEMAHYYVVRPQIQVPDSKATVDEPFWKRWLSRRPSPLSTWRFSIVGYGGFWMMVDEAHISTIASHSDWRRRGVGELLLLSLIDQATELGAHMVTLEVRVSNESAQALYRKYGMMVTGKRKKYYSDNGEDALIMSTPTLTSAEYQRLIQELKTNLFTRLSP
jgi:ribosomal-protein-alanine N-acetyltransferase